MSESHAPSRFQRAFSRVYGWATLRLYKELAWAYDPISRFVSAGRWDAWRRFALDYAHGRVLEIGFGTGELLIALAQRGLSVVGVDASREMQRVTARKLRRLSLTPPRCLARANGLPFPSAAFDTILSTFPAGYILEVASLRELARVLQPGGRLVIVGLAVELPMSWRYPLSIVPGTWEPLWAYFLEAANEAGLAAQVVWREDGSARVPVVIATRADLSGAPLRGGQNLTGLDNPDYDAARGDTLAALAPIAVRLSGDSEAPVTGEGIRSGDRGRYSNAQLDDHSRLPRAAFPNRPPLALTVQARFSHEAARSQEGPGLLGTAGFGFWNDPVAMNGPRLPTLPRAAWFFYAGPPSDMKLDLQTPGRGWKAATIDALRPAAIAPALAAPLMIPLMRSPSLYRRAWPGIQRRLRIAEAAIAGPLTAWREYRLEWDVSRARFYVDGALLLDAPAPAGPLGFVAWCDNQYLIATPQGRVGYGCVPARGQWLEISRLQLSPL